MMIEALIAVALIGALVTFVAPNRIAGKLAFAISLVPAALSLWLFGAFDGSGNALRGGELAFESQAAWLEIGDYSISWFVGLDGISLPLVVLTTILCTLAIVSSWTPIDERQSQFYGLILFIEAMLIGVFSALDFFLWFVFWEAVLIPMYLLIGIWGGPRRKYAAIKFFVYTNVASLVMFGSFVALVFGLGDVTSFALPEVATAMLEGGPDGLFGLEGTTLASVVFIGLFLGFAVKVPIVPFHTWLPDAHVEAPTPASILLAGVLLKMGTYALLRFNFTMFPDQVETYAVPIAAIAVISVIYGAMLALAQTDLKRIVAYSSVSSMGYVILGLVAYTQFGVGGATFQMISHGLISGLMFMAVGVIYNATHTRMVTDMSGLADRMPIAVGVLIAGAFGYMGLPLMSGFAAEYFIFFGSFGSELLSYSALFTSLAMFGIVIVAGYLLFALQRTVFGPYRLETDYEVGRAPVHDVASLLVLLGLVVLLGVAPDLIFDMITDAIDPIVQGGDL
ncbi:proton-translocating NADH-quinone oxidoreductase subunit M [Natrinema pellirubrum DSM 15624]|uniref:Proton-translocating NADH-quinone oxidoreductase subunit M n=1 Tax=Natrinema pellirubrum (strain DSM 15624 / CIP 106293 / JCM 10476 / NCIMB 786 / 157) TaxID=797303 RepID=L0JPV1_NATP1|nr:NuoM family protein [Natrinema pellirubrum]AGB32858.1 proton-translocating NADH-quinone oxidoreductase, chain M [Natrinema pellirubrum DSM 15624]ELY75618.1 proton-translocating NADH-quinone oxidoreductase subunit M [Natrinema pellirubrum DSM 15624]